MRDDLSKLFEKLLLDSTQDKTNEDLFYCSFISDIENFITNYISERISSNEDVLFLYKNYKYIENSLINLFITFDGSSYYYEKSKIIIDSLISFYVTGIEIHFDYTVGNIYYLPQTVLRTHKDIINFYISIKNLFNGNNEMYLNFYKQLEVF